MIAGLQNPPLTRGEVPEAAQGTAIRFATAFDARDKRGIERIALAAVAAFARAHALALFASRFFHGAKDRKLRTQMVNQVSLRTT